MSSEAKRKVRDFGGAYTSTPDEEVKRTGRTDSQQRHLEILVVRQLTRLEDRHRLDDAQAKGECAAWDIEVEVSHRTPTGDHFREGAHPTDDTTRQPVDIFSPLRWFHQLISQLFKYTLEFSALCFEIDRRQCVVFAVGLRLGEVRVGCEERQ